LLVYFEKIFLLFGRFNIVQDLLTFDVLFYSFIHGKGCLRVKLALKYVSAETEDCHKITANVLFQDIKLVESGLDDFLRYFFDLVLKMVNMPVEKADLIVFVSNYRAKT
jgi:hypothetical protein